jgi:hypothetical protein
MQRGLDEVLFSGTVPSYGSIMTKQKMDNPIRMVWLSCRHQEGYFQ